MQDVGFGLVQEDSLGRSMFKLDAEAGSSRLSAVVPLPDIGESTGDGGGGGHRGGYQVGASTFALAAFEVSIGCRRATFAWLQAIWVHGQTHTATSLAPIESRFAENSVQAL